MGEKERREGGRERDWFRDVYMRNMVEAMIYGTGYRLHPQ